MKIRVRNLDAQTSPCVLHHAGGDALSAYGLEFKRRFFDLLGSGERRFAFSKSGRSRGLQLYRRPAPRRPLRRIPNLSIVTWTSFRFPGSAQLSANALGFEIDVVRVPGRWRNLRKLRLLRDYLERVETDYLLFLDSHDTFVTSDLEGIVDAFGKLDCRLLFQADSHDWPPCDATREFYAKVADPGSPFGHLCSGIFLGEVPMLRRVVARALETPPLLPNDDQGVYKQVFPEFHPEARLDTGCRLFQPLTDYRDRRKPERFRPIELRLELVCEPDPDDAADPLALTAAKLLHYPRYWAARRFEALLDGVERALRGDTERDL